MSQPTFKELEHAGWLSRAAAYDDYFAPVTRQAVGPLLDALHENLAERDLLDICTGTGHLAGAAGARGARVVGVDFADSMVVAARKNYPDVRFRQGDAEHLPFPDASFILPFAPSGCCISETRRRVCAKYSAFCGPVAVSPFRRGCRQSGGFDLYRIVGPAIQQYGVANVELPAAPPTFRFADPAECRSVLGAIGFGEVVCTEEASVWNGPDGQAVLDLIYKGIVRTPMLIDAQPAAAAERIRAAIVKGAEAYRKGVMIEFSWPYLLVTAIKPSMASV